MHPPPLFPPIALYLSLSLAKEKFHFTTSATAILYCMSQRGWPETQLHSNDLNHLSIMLYLRSGSFHKGALEITNPLPLGAEKS